MYNAINVTTISLPSPKQRLPKLPYAQHSTGLYQQGFSHVTYVLNLRHCQASQVHHGRRLFILGGVADHRYNELAQLVAVAQTRELFTRRRGNHGGGRREIRWRRGSTYGRGSLHSSGELGGKGDRAPSVGGENGPGYLMSACCTVCRSQPVRICCDACSGVT